MAVEPKRTYKTTPYDQKKLKNRLPITPTKENGKNSARAVELIKIFFKYFFLIRIYASKNLMNQNYFLLILKFLGNLLTAFTFRINPVFFSYFINRVSF
jgi:hypothetical protein